MFICNRESLILDYKFFLSLKIRDFQEELLHYGYDVGDQDSDRLGF